MRKLQPDWPLKDMGRPSLIRLPANLLPVLPRVLAVAGLGLLVANCAQNPQQGRRLSGQESREIGAFPQRKFGAASPRVVADGEAVPKGGGRDHVGRSYSIAGKRYTPYEKPVGYTISGAASWYGPAFHGRKTANGEVYDRHGVSAAHPTMPLPSYARVTNLGNRRSIVVRVNDRGPYHGGRIIDLSQRTADLLEFRHLGTARVKVEYLGRASLRGSDDRALMASLTTDGTPASIPGFSQPGTMIANAPPLTTPRAIAATGLRDGSDTQAPANLELASSTRPVTNVTAVSQARQQPRVEPAPTEEAARAVRGAPVPPERPFDLATIPGAGVPLAFAGARPAARTQTAAVSRPVVASLYFADPIGPGQRFSPSHPLTLDLKPQRFVALR